MKTVCNKNDFGNKKPRKLESSADYHWCGNNDNQNGYVVVDIGALYFPVDILYELVIAKAAWNSILSLLALI